MSGVVCHVNEIDQLPDAIYIGRRANRFGLAESPFHNPFKVTDLGREAVIREYIDYLIREPNLLRRLPELRERPLACWCRRSDQTEPPCHGDVLLGIMRMVPDELLTRLERNAVSDMSIVEAIPGARHLIYTAVTGAGIHVVDIGGIAEYIYRELYPLREAVHG